MEENIRNVTALPDGRFNCEIEHPLYGWIPFTADPNDPEQRGRDIWAAIMETNPPSSVATDDPTIVAPTVDDYRRAIDAHVEATARSRQYNSAAHMATYVNSTVPEWAAEAQAFVAWRDQVWLTAIGMLATTTEAPKIEAVIEALPQIEWPEE